MLYFSDSNELHMRFLCDCLTARCSSAQTEEFINTQKSDTGLIKMMPPRRRMPAKGEHLSAHITLRAPQTPLEFMVAATEPMYSRIKLRGLRTTSKGPPGTSDILDTHRRAGPFTLIPGFLEVLLLNRQLLDVRVYRYDHELFCLGCLYVIKEL